MGHLVPSPAAPLSPSPIRLSIRSLCTGTSNRRRPCRHRPAGIDEAVANGRPLAGRRPANTVPRGPGRVDSQLRPDGAFLWHSVPPVSSAGDASHAAGQGDGMIVPPCVRSGRKAIRRGSGKKAAVHSDDGSPLKALAAGDADDVAHLCRLDSFFANAIGTADQTWGIAGRDDVAAVDREAVVGIRII